MGGVFSWEENSERRRKNTAGRTELTSGRRQECAPWRGRDRDSGIQAEGIIAFLEQCFRSEGREQAVPGWGGGRLNSAGRNRPPPRVAGPDERALAPERNSCPGIQGERKTESGQNIRSVRFILRPFCGILNSDIGTAGRKKAGRRNACRLHADQIFCFSCLLTGGRSARMVVLLFLLWWGCDGKGWISCMTN